ncbi:hypothetical protein CDAR_507261 [Caerostris darwini]|uniref:Uncharacterized protein n=1 Tax=Caerostris darwini TaxID=1538125 RepID=A0AAV4WBB8_9ARAC|nr:hypothetical protein CDAR_507261 [Caerostris darwini]
MVTSKAITQVPFFRSREELRKREARRPARISHSRINCLTDPSSQEIRAFHRDVGLALLSLISCVHKGCCFFNPTPVGGCDFIVALDENGLFVRVACASVLCIFVDQTQPTGIWVFSVMFKDFRGECLFFVYLFLCLSL